MKIKTTKLKLLTLMLLTLSLIACSDDSGETLSLPADAHSNPQILAQTVATDLRLKEQAREGTRSAQIFDTETELLQRGVKKTGQPVNKPAERKAFLGDLHVHTTYSFDGYAFGTLATPYDAYRFAKGESISNPAGFAMQLSRPLDFYAVTDHAMFLGVVEAAADT